MKPNYLLLALLLAAASLNLSAQGNKPRHRIGVAFGVDRDTNQYLIMSPFDNWFVHAQAGIQTFKGNELVSSARHNKLNYSLQLEVGKWMIPDLAVSLKFQYFDVDGQSQYSLQPFIDLTSDTPNDNGYYPFHAHAIGLVGLVTLDWTNFFLGYEKGKAKALHIYTPVGLGASMLYGRQRNPRGFDKYGEGALRRNFELTYTAGIGAEYIVVPERLSIGLIADVLGSESTWDWSPYDNAHSRFDVMPSIRITSRFNFLHQAIKRSPFTGNDTLVEIYHRFLDVRSSRVVKQKDAREKELTEQIRDLNNDIAKLQDRPNYDPIVVAQIEHERDSVQKLFDNYRREHPYVPINVLDNLIDTNMSLNLPMAVIYYQLDRYDIDYNGRRRLQRFAKEIEGLDDTLRFFIIGAADSITGSIRHNQWLSERRCEAAHNLLMGLPNVTFDRFDLEAAGGIMDYDPPEFNRMALIILRTPDTEKIVARWRRMRERR